MHAYTCTFNEKRDHEFEEEQGRVNRKVLKEEGENNYFIISENKSNKTMFCSWYGGWSV